MYPSSLLLHWHKLTAWAAVSLTVVAVAWVVNLMIPAFNASCVIESNTVATRPTLQQAVSLTGLDWAVFKSAGPDRSASSSLEDRYRLAGTFFEYTEGQDQSRKAILADMKLGIQHIVEQDEQVDGIKVIRLFRDRIVLRDAMGDHELWLSFSAGAGKARTPVKGFGTGAPGAGDSDLTGLDDFGGKQIGDNKWVFSRDKLMSYYAELRDQPTRLLTVFDSLDPLREGESRRITGYQLNVKGEDEFFESVGLREGDVIRSVNSMRMTSRRRAEYFIKEFVKDRANGFIFDIERNGEKEKLVYQVR